MPPRLLPPPPPNPPFPTPLSSPMKKNYAYVLVPLIALIIFGAIYWNFNTHYEAKLAEKARQEQAAKRAKLEQEAKDREKAIKDAVAAQEQRKAEKAIRDEKLKADQEARTAAQQAREKARIDQDKFNRQVERLEKEIDVEKAAIAKIEADNKSLVDRETFLRTFVKQAEDNTKSLTDVLTKIDAADKANAAAAAAAAAKAKKS